MAEIIPFSVEESAIGGLHVVTMKHATDERGTVREAYRASAFADAGLDVGPWVQMNVTETKLGAIRGLHGEDMTKLVAVVAGAAHGVYLDTRAGSSTRGEVVEVHLSPGTQVLVPAGVCNGFQALTEGMQYLYAFDREWQPGIPGVAVTPLDPELGISWPLPVGVDDPSLLSDKDRHAPLFADL